MGKRTRRGTDPAAEEKRARRLARREAEALEKQRLERRQRLRTWLAGAAIAAVVLAGGWLLFRPAPELDGVERPRNEGREHVDQGTAIDYDHPAPTSGPHWAAAPPCRVYDQPLELELAVHALEHGTVVVWHRPDIDDGHLDQLHDLTRRWDSHVIVSPNPGIGDPIVATAWDRRMAFAEPGDDVADFVDVYRQRGPERVDCPQAG